MVATAAGAAILGDNIGYVIGRCFGLYVLTLYGCLVGLTEGRLLIGQYLFRKHGGKIVFFGRFVAFLRTFAALLAGANAMRWDHFLLMNVLGGVGWASIFGFGAYFLGSEARRIAGPTSIIFFASAVGLLVASGLFVRRHEKELEAGARREVSPLLD